MTHTEWEWLIGKPCKEPMIVADDAFLQMLADYEGKKTAEAFKRGVEAMRPKIEAAFKRGAEAMREAAASTIEAKVSNPYINRRMAEDIRALPIPEDKP
jgi:predicted DNA-binding protein (UPF0278 family)